MLGSCVSNDGECLSVAWHTCDKDCTFCGDWSWLYQTMRVWRHIRCLCLDSWIPPLRNSWCQLKRTFCSVTTVLPPTARPVERSLRFSNTLSHDLVAALHVIRDHWILRQPHDTEWLEICSCKCIPFLLHHEWTPSYRWFNTDSQQDYAEYYDCVNKHLSLCPHCL